MAEMLVVATPVGVKETAVAAIPMQAGWGIRVEAATQVAEIEMAGTPALETVATLAAIRVATIPAVGMQAAVMGVPVTAVAIIPAAATPEAAMATRIHGILTGSKTMASMWQLSTFPRTSGFL